MFARLFIVLIIGFVVFVGLRMALGRKNLTVNQFLAIYAATMLGIGLLFLGLTGRLHPLFALLGAILPFFTRFIGVLTRGAQLAALYRFLRTIGLGGFTPGRSAGHAPNSSEISSRYLHMILFHDTGLMDGTVLEGQFKDQKLSQLELDQLKTLLMEIQEDADSYNLLLAYLDRDHAGWQAGDGTHHQTRATDDEMSESHALEILGLEHEASRDEIIQAHRRMMQKMHPDRGGSTYLAAKINAAKDYLLAIRPE